MIPSDTDWAYAAGLFDGEGCVVLPHTANGSYFLNVAITMRGLPALNRLRDTLGGKVFLPSIDLLGRPTTGRWVPSSFPTTGSHAGKGHEVKKAFLEGILPHVVLKRRQVELAIAFLTDRLTHRSGDPVDETTLLMYGRLSSLMVAEKDMWRGMNSAPLEQETSTAEGEV